MITQENLKKQYSLIKVSFGIKFASKNEEEAYIKVLFKVLTKHSLTDENITEGAQNLIMNKTKEDFAKMFGFGGIPAPADFVKFFGGKLEKEPTLDEIATHEVDRIIFESRVYFSNWKPQNPTTKLIINSFPKGLNSIYDKFFNTHTKTSEDLEIFKKDLVEKWLSYERMKNKHLAIEV
jgi:hypothetical protein